MIVNAYSHLSTSQMIEMIDRIFATENTFIIQHLCNPLTVILTVEKHMHHIVELECVSKGFENGYDNIPETDRYYLANEAVKLVAAIGEYTRQSHYNERETGLFTVYKAIEYIQTNYGWLEDISL